MLVLGNITCIIFLSNLQHSIDFRYRYNREAVMDADLADSTHIYNHGYWQLNSFASTNILNWKPLDNLFVCEYCNINYINDIINANNRMFCI